MARTRVRARSLVSGTACASIRMPEDRSVECEKRGSSVFSSGRRKPPTELFELPRVCRLEWKLGRLGDGVGEGEGDIEPAGEGVR